MHYAKQTQLQPTRNNKNQHKKHKKTKGKTMEKTEKNGG